MLQQKHGRPFFFFFTFGLHEGHTHAQTHTHTHLKVTSLQLYTPFILSVEPVIPTDECPSNTTLTRLPRARVDLPLVTKFNREYYRAIVNVISLFFTYYDKSKS